MYGMFRWRGRPPLVILIAAAAFVVSGCVTYFPNSPVRNGDFPDPAIIKTPSDNFRGYSTNRLGQNGWINVPQIKSTALGLVPGWENKPDALPTPEGWGTGSNGYVWAPDVREFPNDWVLYYTMKDNASGRQCIGREVADDAQGPYSPTLLFAPLVCQPGKGGSIDPYVFRNPQSGNVFVIWKSDGNAVQKTTRIWSQKLASDGLTVVSSTNELLADSEPWESAFGQRNIEGPAVDFREQNGVFYLYYSGADYRDSSYAVGYAYSTSGVTDPFIRGDFGSGGPILVTGGDGSGPGGESLVNDADGKRWMAYHAYAPGAGDGTPRHLRFSRLRYDANDRPELGESP